jgi:pyridoxal phosphate enzyme (YggS family)
LIGAQQSRKLKLVPGAFDWYQALDSIDHADLLNRYCAEQSLGIDVLLQVNIGAEEQKRGISPGRTIEAADWITQNCPSLTLRGLMAIPPGPDHYDSHLSFERGTRAHFAALREMFAKISRAAKAAEGEKAFDTLSMGMSQDYIWALKEGATMVRLGSALFEGLEG